MKILTLLRNQRLVFAFFAAAILDDSRMERPGSLRANRD